MTQKQNAMTEKQRVESILNRKKPDRVPTWPFAYNGFAAIYNNLPLVAAYNDAEACYAAMRKTCQDFGWVFWPAMMYASIGAWEFGGEIRMPSGDYDQAPMVIRSPVEKDEDVYNLKWPAADSGIFPVAAKYGELARMEKFDNAPFYSTIAAGGAFNLAGNIAGVERFMKWLVKKPQLAHYLIQEIADWESAGLLQQHKMLGIEGVLGVGGSAISDNQLISPRQFAEFALPSIKAGQRKLRELGYKTTFVHICGEQNLNLPYWAEVDFGDPGIISVGHEVKLETAAKYFPRDVIFGNLEPAIIQTKTPAEVYEATRKVVEEGKKIEGGYIFSPGCDLPPRSPLENIRAMNKAVDDYGWY